jgi:tetratricopeptide (TPR) repeat protein
MKAYETAFPVIKALAAEFPDIPRHEDLLSRLLREYGQMLAARGDAPGGCALFEEGIRLLPDDFPLHFILAWWCANASDEGQRDIPKAIRVAERAVEIAPDAHAVWLVLGAARHRVGDSKGAVEALDRAAAFPSGSRDFRTWLLLTLARWELGEEDAARACYDKALAVIGNRAGGVVMRQLRAEAAALLGLESQLEDQ